MDSPQLSVSQFIDVANQTLDYAFGSILIEGEVSSFKLNQAKYIFFDLKDESSSVGCFMMAYQLRLPIEDGMKVVVRATPKLTKWGKFSLTIQTITPVGEGSLKKSFQILKDKLTKEGLFSTDRKRQLPEIPENIAVISSTAAAGYKDFIKILDDRWGGVSVQVAHTQVQGEGAADQIISAIESFNQKDILPEVLVIVRGGGSADDLAIFNDEKLVRVIASSRIPIITGIGHEVDESLADLAADVRASTPTNAAQLIVPDKKYIISHLQSDLHSAARTIENNINATEGWTRERLKQAIEQLKSAHTKLWWQLDAQEARVNSLNPTKVLERGYAVIRGEPKIGAMIQIETFNKAIEAEVKYVKEKRT